MFVLWSSPHKYKYVCPIKKSNRIPPAYLKSSKELVLCRWWRRWLLIQPEELQIIWQVVMRSTLLIMSSCGGPVLPLWLLPRTVLLRTCYHFYSNCSSWWWHKLWDACICLNLEVVMMKNCIQMLGLQAYTSLIPNLQLGRHLLLWVCVCICGLCREGSDPT